MRFCFVATATGGGILLKGHAEAFKKAELLIGQPCEVDGLDRGLHSLRRPPIAAIQYGRSCSDTAELDCSLRGDVDQRFYGYSGVRLGENRELIWRRTAHARIKRTACKPDGAFAPAVTAISFALGSH